jgi:hypothetical protein
MLAAVVQGLRSAAGEDATWNDEASFGVNPALQLKIGCAWCGSSSPLE